MRSAPSSSWRRPTPRTPGWSSTRLIARSPTKIHRVLRLYGAGALDGRRIVLLGDDDLISVAIARFARLTGASVRQLTVIDSDPAVLAWIGEQTAGTGVDVQLAEHDLRLPLPGALAGAFDVACTDPPYTVPGARLFLSRAVSALERRPGEHVFFSFGARRPAETLATQRLIADLGLVVRSVTPNFNQYVGAGILAGTSHLYHLRSSAETAPLIEDEYAGPLYTADSRAEQSRPYRCAQLRGRSSRRPRRRAGHRTAVVPDLRPSGRRLPGVRRGDVPAHGQAAALTGRARHILASASLASTFSGPRLFAIPTAIRTYSSPFSTLIDA